MPLQRTEVRPGYLELREVEANIFAVMWKVPGQGEYRLAIEPRFPDFCRWIGERLTAQTGGAFFERGRIRCERNIGGERISIDGLSATQTDVLARIEARDGRTQTARLTPGQPDVTVSADPSRLEVVWTYLQLGIEHILTGFDHLLFVLCLVLLIPKVSRLLATITAFTLAHSITLAAATLGIVNVPSPPVEATIALSIVFLAGELARKGSSDGITRSYPWLVAFTFGLLHGLGFAGALAEVGLPQGQIPTALLFFNIGVELGQVLFVAAVLAVMALIRSMRPVIPRWLEFVPPYAIGTLATVWVLQRVAAF